MCRQVMVEEGKEEEDSDSDSDGDDEFGDDDTDGYSQDIRTDPENLENHLLRGMRWLFQRNDLAAEEIVVPLDGNSFAITPVSMRRVNRRLEEEFNVVEAEEAVALAEEEEVLKVLVRTPMRLMHVALPAMKERNSGVVINVSSVASYIAGGAYSASKAYLTVLSESLSTELAATNIKVSALCPGFTRTEFHQRGRMKMAGLPNFMWLNSDVLVAKAWKDAISGKPVSIPGWQYKTLIGIISLLPRSIVRRLGMNLRVKQR